MGGHPYHWQTTCTHLRRPRSLLTTLHTHFSFPFSIHPHASYHSSTYPNLVFILHQFIHLHTPTPSTSHILLHPSYSRHHTPLITFLSSPYHPHPYHTPIVSPFSSLLVNPFVWSPFPFQLLSRPLPTHIHTRSMFTLSTFLFSIYVHLVNILKVPLFAHHPSIPFHAFNKKLDKSRYGDGTTCA